MAGTAPIYDRIGTTYTETRKPDARIAAQLHAALGDASTVLNVGAGTGNYEPTDRRLMALEPSMAMINQRTSDVPVVQAPAEAIPFADDSFDAVMGTFTVHHWPDRQRGLEECRRVAERQVLIVYEPELTNQYWFFDYFTALRSASWEQDAPTVDELAVHLDVIDVEPLWVPADCTDGFAGAFWNRPEAYLRDDVQAGMSTLARLPASDREEGANALASALESGEWDRRFGHLRDEDQADLGYRLVTAESS